MDLFFIKHSVHCVIYCTKIYATYIVKFFVELCFSLFYQYYLRAIHTFFIFCGLHLVKVQS